MSQEIERKFLVTSHHFKQESYKKNYIKQGFLNTDKERTVRVRLLNDTGFLTVKGKSNKSGTTRFEWEKEISKKDAEQLLLLCEKHVIEKYRYLVDFNNHIFEIDEFLGKNKGLIIAEIELQDENESFIKPYWVDKEVTGCVKYYNSQLSKNPFAFWKK